MIEIYDDVKRLRLNAIQTQDRNSNILSQKEFDRLKENIKTNGFVDPVKVIKTGKNEYLLVDGHHRLRAMEELGSDFISAIIIKDKHKENLINAIRFNTERGQQNPKVLAEILRELKKSGYSLKDIEDKLIYDEDVLKDTLDLLNLPDNVDEVLREENEKLSEDLPEIWTFVVPAEYSDSVQSMFSDEIRRGKKLGMLCQQQKPTK